MILTKFLLARVAHMWCRLTFRHRGRVNFIDHRPFWKCDNCGEVVW